MHVSAMLIYTAIILTALEFFGNIGFFIRHFPELARAHYGLYQHLWWAFTTIILFLPIPVLIVKVGFRHNLRDYGLTLNLTRKHLLVYACMVLFMIPIIFFVSNRSDFMGIYPFYRGALKASPYEILIWEGAYLFQFIALEFFFRGFLVLGLERHIGRNSILVAMVPYCMIHFHKPPLEAFAAIAAGLILGEVAIRTRSVFGGVLMHISIAAAMDILALKRTGIFF